ncbi:uncharacterized protein [Chironomus tepperi]|uniref:uncharacterized protein isoform X2 n=1 Tax=Chironomus tepperi TaxID=113505 RepID=UPI00391EE8FC
MIMTENQKQFGDYCSGCKKDFSHGDRIILARNLKFFHFNCYARKNFFYRWINSIESYFIWQESIIVAEELNDSLKKYLTLVLDKKEEAEIAASGDAKGEIHELEISKVVDISKKVEEKKQACGTILDTTLEEERVAEMTDRSK